MTGTDSSREASPWRRRAAWAVAIAAALPVFVVVSIYAASEHRLRARYPVPDSALVLDETGATVARGEHLVRSVVACPLCHGDDLGGNVYADMGPIGIVAGSNLTRGRGGVGATFSRADWVRAIRYGVRADGTSLIMMPSEVFTNLSNVDLASIIVYITSVPPVDREPPKSHFAYLGRALLAAGRLSILTAPKTHHSSATERPDVSSAVQQGRYIADVSGCHGCHGYGLSGGPVAGPPGLPPAANLTPTGLSGWTLQDFARLMRTGRRPDGAPINDFMPWRVYSTMSESELAALWAYLQSVPPRPSGNK